MTRGPIFSHRGRFPQLDPSVFVAATASVIGEVSIGVDSSVWYGAVLRGDVMAIRIGAHTSIQDNSVVHATGGWSETVIGDEVTVGHAVILHGCRIGPRVLVGMGSIVLDDAEIGERTMLGAGSLVTARTKIPAGVLAHGRPAKAVRDLRPDELENVLEASRLYVQYAREHRESIGP